MATGTAVEVVMPQMGVSVSEGTITKWLKGVGERVEADEPLLEISTDKVDTEVPSPGAGVLSEILVHEGETVEVGTVLARIATTFDMSTSIALVTCAAVSRERRMCSAIPRRMAFIGSRASPGCAVAASAATG